MNSLLIGLALAASYGGGQIYTPSIHKPTPTDSARNLTAAEAKRERKRRKLAAIEAKKDEPKPMKSRGVYLPTTDRNE